MGKLEDHDHEAFVLDRGGGMNRPMTGGGGVGGWLQCCWPNRDEKLSAPAIY